LFVFYFKAAVAALMNAGRIVRSFLDLASSLEQVANLLCAQVNSAAYPQWNGM